MFDRAVRKKSNFSHIFTTLVIFIIFLLPLNGFLNKTTTLPKAENILYRQNNPANGTVIWITDIHFNPFFDSSLLPRLLEAKANQWEKIFQSSLIKTPGDYFKNETNYRLLLSALKKMKNNFKKLDFLIFTGDFLAHNFKGKYFYYVKQKNNLYDFINKTVTFLAIMFNKYLPGIPIYICIGNNDCYHGDYQIKPGGEFLKRTSIIYATHFIKNGLNKKSFLATYSRGGYYSVIPPGSADNQLISLNSVLFSPRHKDGKGDNNTAEKQLSWLNHMLENARVKKRKIWLLMHIPPGIDVYRSQRKGFSVPFWQKIYQKKFQQILIKYSSVIRAGFAGHTHMDDFRIFFKTAQKTQTACFFIKISPAISPEFGNNPGFSCLIYTRADFIPVNYKVYFLDLNNRQQINAENLQWKMEYELNKAYLIEALTPKAIQAMYLKIKSNESFLAKYLKYYDVSHGVTLNKKNWKAYWQAIAN